MTCRHANPNCGCKNSSWVWINLCKRFIFLENPKAGSTYVKQKLIEPDNGKLLSSREEVVNYPELKVFGIYRDPAEKMFSVFKDFTKSNKEHRIQRMVDLFRDYSKEEVVGLSFSEFLDLALAYRDPHWDSNFTYLFVPDRDITLFRYCANVMERVKNFLDLPHEFSTERINTSEEYTHAITLEEREKIREIMKADYENPDYFLERMK